MIRVLAIFLAAVSIAWCDNSLTGQERKEGFELLFDGKSIAKWHSIRQQPDAGAWRAQKGILTHEKGESWLATNDTYFDFVLRLEYRTGPGSNSGILLRAGSTGDPAASGMELRILSDAGKPANTQSTGSLWDIVAPARSVNKPDGEWNEVEVTLIKRELSAIWNGQKILDVNLDDPKYKALAQRGPYGHIGLEGHASGTPVEFRNIRVKILKIGPLLAPEK
jgi:hypothetical protein